EVQSRFDRDFREVIVPFLPDVEFEGVSFVIPKKGNKRKVLDVGMKNAQQYMKDLEKAAEKLNPERSVEKLMAQMKSDFRLNVEPRHIECFDNSNIQGTNPVASCVVFRNGKPSKRDYRHFNIKTVVGANDFASMKEILHRRYTRMMAEGESRPQLVVVDGGKGQLSAAVEAFDEMGIRGEVALVGIAKRLEEIYFPGDSLPLYIDKKSPSLRVVQALRDEAHRFGITHHRNRRSKGQVVSELDRIPGIGPATSATLMKTFKSLKRVKEASLEDITAAVGKSKANIVYGYFHPL
ncbi:MAG: excinuclease ABC subunit C, partial [Muribaculaceae bacterium]|nr:excinuclease ABC subunit C [Muribaculaceae bacterium]